MGTDINLYVEIKEDEGIWRPILVPNPYYTQRH